MAKEIERIWLCKGYLDFEVYPEVAHTCTFTDYTSYLFVSEALEIRIRERHVVGQAETLFRLAVKSGNGIVREEYEEDITFAAYAELAKAIPKHRAPIIGQSQAYYAIDNNHNEIKIYVCHTDDDFFRAEIEFPNEEAAKNFICPFPDWHEVTGLPQWAMKNYWVRTRIQGGN